MQGIPVGVRARRPLQYDRRKLESLPCVRRGELVRGDPEALSLEYRVAVSGVGRQDQVVIGDSVAAGDAATHDFLSIHIDDDEVVQACLRLKSLGMGNANRQQER